MSHSRLDDMLDLAHVPRWSTVPHLRPQSVAEHSYRVAAIALEIARRLNMNQPPPIGNVIESKVLLWALLHDTPESETGDMPAYGGSPLRRIKDSTAVSKLEFDLCPWLKGEPFIHPPEKLIVKLADKIEEVLFLREWGTASQKCVEALDMALNQVNLHALNGIAQHHWTNPSIVVICDDILKGQLIDYVQLRSGPGSGPGSGPAPGLPQT